MVKKDKFILTINTGKGGEIERRYKTYKEIAEALQVDYHMVRQLHLISTKRFLHPGLKLLSSKYSIKSIDPVIVTNWEHLL